MRGSIAIVCSRPFEAVSYTTGLSFSLYKVTRDKSSIVMNYVLKFGHGFQATPFIETFTTSPADLASGFFGSNMTSVLVIDLMHFIVIVERV